MCERERGREGERERERERERGRERERERLREISFIAFTLLKSLVDMYMYMYVNTTNVPVGWHLNGNGGYVTHKQVQ